MFRRPSPQPDPEPESSAPVAPHDELDDEMVHGPTDDEEFDPERVRDLCFEVLRKRVGPETADAMREDFDEHIENDGIEQAWVCLFGKMVNAMDRAMQLIVHGSLPEDEEFSPDDAAIADFDSFR